MYSPVLTKGTFDNWGAISSSSVREDSTNPMVPKSHTGTRAVRCFQVKMPPSEQLITENYYCGTRNITPGPASYKVYASYKASVAPTVKSSTFGSSGRLLSTSMSLYQPNILSDNPGAGEYEVPSTFKQARRAPSTADAGRSQSGKSSSSLPFSVYKGQSVTLGSKSTVSSTEDYLRVNLATAQARLRSLKENIRSSTKVTAEVRKASERDYQVHHQRLTQKVEMLQSALDAINQSQEKAPASVKIPASRSISGHTNPCRSVSSAVRPAFSSSGRREFQESPSIQEAPTFYMSDKEWDFGADSRHKTQDMNAFGFSDIHNQFKEEETKSHKPILVGLKPYPNRCRETDFYGDRDGDRSITPGVGAYSPPFLPASDPLIQSTVSKTMRGMSLQK